MKKTVMLFLALALLTTTAWAAGLPSLPDGALPDALLQAAERDGTLGGAAAWLAETARGALNGILRAGTRSAALLILTAMVCGAAEGLAAGAGKTAAGYVPYCGVLAASALAAGDIEALIGLGARTIDELGAMAKLLLPTLAASMAAGGLVSTAGVWQVTTLMACDALATVIARVLLPLVYCYLAASAADAVLGGERLGALPDTLKALVTGALKLASAAFTGYLAVAGVLTGSADRAAVKAAKAAVSGTVPIVGGVLADAAESVLAAAGGLRGTIGTLGVAGILAVCLVPLLRLGAQFLLYKLAAFASGLVGTRALAGFFDRLGEAFAMVFAMTAACALVLLVALLVAVAVAA